MQESEVYSPIRDHRHSFGESMTQAKYGHKIGVSGNTIARWERLEESPSGEKLLKMVQFAGIEVVEGHTLKILWKKIQMSNALFSWPELLFQRESTITKNATILDNYKALHFESRII